MTVIPRTTRTDRTDRTDRAGRVAGRRAGAPRPATALTLTTLHLPTRSRTMLLLTEQLARERMRDRQREARQWALHAPARSPRRWRPSAMAASRRPRPAPLPAR